MANPSYRERMRAASAQRKAEKAEWQRRSELMATARLLALEAVKAGIRGRGDRPSHYTYAQLNAQADAMIGPWLILRAKERIAARTVHTLPQSVDTSSATPQVSQ
jgi:hypothetical protein